MLTGKSVSVVRTGDGVKALHNHCRHRGVPIAGIAPETLARAHQMPGGNFDGRILDLGF